MSPNKRLVWSKRLGGGLLLACAVSVAGGCAMAEPARLGPVVEPAELAKRLNRSSAERPLVIDVRDAKAYDAGHVAGAVRLDFSKWEKDSVAAPTGLDHRTLWRERIGNLGVSGRDPVVIYDNGHMTHAARIWFIFQHFGVPEAGVLNGGYPALEPLIADGKLSVSRAPTTPRPTTFSPMGTTETRIALVGRQRVRNAVERKAAQIFDARTPAEYTGKDPLKNPRGGHIPTAINLPHKQLLDDRGRLKTPEALAALFARAGFQRGQPIITHCDGGGRASLAALAAQRAGYGPVMNYYLSYGDWAADRSCPVVQPNE
jgi:thiosulfate/3-mercaptopyruvate sulfurtransferase